MVEDDMDHGVVEPTIQKKRQHDDEGQDHRRRTDVKPSKKSSTLKESSIGKTPTKTSKTGKSVTAKEPVKETVQEVPMDVEESILDDVVNDTDQPQDDDLAPRNKTTPTGFKQLPSSPSHLTIPVGFFSNNDLEYLKTGNSERKYTVLITKISKHDVYSTMKVLSVVSVKVDKQYGYGYLEEIFVRRVD
ncbi:hypothetical protein Tco_1202015 [Tanacetum coccineum]